MLTYDKVRFIPALAGNTAAVTILAANRAVYPRSRGEHVSTSNEQAGMTGLSPLSRGTLTKKTGIPPGTRFIPALAGNTS